MKLSTSRPWAYISLAIGDRAELYRHRGTIPRAASAIMRAQFAINHPSSGLIWMRTHIFASIRRECGTKITKEKAIAQFPQFTTLIT